MLLFFTFYLLLQTIEMKFYCDYCDTFLTHNSPSVRKTHNGGRKHKDNVRMFYQMVSFAIHLSFHSPLFQWLEEQTQKLVDATARAFALQQRLQTIQQPVALPPVALPYALVHPGMSQGMPLPVRPPIPMNMYHHPQPPPAFYQPPVNQIPMPYIKIEPAADQIPLPSMPFIKQEEE